MVVSCRHAVQETLGRPRGIPLDFVFIVWNGRQENTAALYSVLADVRRHHMPYVGILGPSGAYPVPEVTETCTIAYFDESGKYFEDGEWQWKEMIAHLQGLDEEMRRDPSLA